MSNISQNFSYIKHITRSEARTALASIYYAPLPPPERDGGAVAGPCSSPQTRLSRAVPPSVVTRKEIKRVFSWVNLGIWFTVAFSFLFNN